MSLFYRTLTIHAKDLGENVTLLLTFDSQKITGLYNDCFPTAWRVTTFGAKGTYAMTASFQSQLAFLKPEVNGGDVIVSASTWVDINLGQSTKLKQPNPQGPFQFSDPVTSVPLGYVEAWNKTSLKQDIGIGFDNNPNSQPETILYFPGVGPNYYCIGQFTPVLSAYIVTNYQQNQILRGAIQTPVIWQQDLADLGDSTSFTLSKDEAKGTYTLSQDKAGVTMNETNAKLLYLEGKDKDTFFDLLSEVTKAPESN